MDSPLSWQFDAAQLSKLGGPKHPMERRSRPYSRDDRLTRTRFQRFITTTWPRLLFGLVWFVCANTASFGQDVHPLLPPWPCCSDTSCRSHVQCIPVPFVPIPESDVATDPMSGPHWQLTIHEAIRVALSNSEVVRNLGLVDARSDVDIVRARITTYDPMAAYAAAEGEWGIFDPVLTTRMQWEREDLPPGTSFSGVGNRPPELDTADVITSLEQLLPLGTRLRTDYVTDYLFNPDNPVGLDPNPQYFSYAQFGVQQPVLQGLGVDVTMAPIRIACAQAERTDWKFKQEMLALVRSIENAYWNLYSEQQNLRAVEDALPLFHEIVRVREEQAKGPSGIQTEVAQATSGMLLYEQRRLDILSNIAEQQLVIRDLLGLPPSDGRYLSLIALPIKSPPFQTVGDAIMTAVNRRPDVLRQRLAVYVAQQEQVLARDALRPQLDFNAFWRINGLGDDLGDSMEVIGENDFHDWQLGVGLRIPLGRRQARGDLRAAELLIQKQRALLDHRAHQASFEVADAYRRVIWLSQQYSVSSKRVAALVQWREGARAHFENPPAGVSTVLALELYLNNLRDFVEASIKSNAILAEFNSALSRLEEVKGTLLESRLVEVEGDATDEVPEELPEPSVEVPEWLLPATSSSSGTSTVPTSQGPPSLAVPSVDSVEIADTARRSPITAASTHAIPAAASSTPTGQAPTSLTVQSEVSMETAKATETSPTTDNSNDEAPSEAWPTTARRFLRRLTQ
jgi:outer membrane protein TolC